MPITFGWYDEAQTILFYRLVGRWTLEENIEGDAKVQQLLQNVSKRFDVIVDLTESSYTPPPGFLWDWKQTSERADTLFPNWGLTVFVSKSRVFAAYFEGGIQVSPAIQKHTRLAKTIKKAIKIIQADRASSLPVTTGA